MSRIVFLTLLVLYFNGIHAKDNLELESLRIEFDNFITQQEYKPYAKAEKAQAKTAIESLYNQRGEVKKHAVYMARNYLKKAKMAAEKAYLENALKETDAHLQTVNMTTLKAEATLARMEADRAQLLIKLHAEEAERARQEKQSAIELANQKASEAEMTQAELQAAQAYAKAQEKVAALAKEEADLAFAEIEAEAGVCDRVDQPRQHLSFVSLDVCIVQRDGSCPPRRESIAIAEPDISTLAGFTG